MSMNLGHAQIQTAAKAVRKISGRLRLTIIDSMDHYDCFYQNLTVTDRKEVFGLIVALTENQKEGEAV